MNIKQNSDVFFSLILLIPTFFILISASIPEQDTIICKEGVITLKVNNKSLETITNELSNKCNLKFFLDQNSRNILINANFKGYPIEYAIKKILEGTQLNFVIYKNDIDNTPWSIYIGPSKNPGESPSYVEIGTNKQDTAKIKSYPQNPSTHYQSPQNNPLPSSKPISQPQSKSTTPQQISIPTAGGYLNEPAQKSNTQLEYDLVPTNQKDNSLPNKIPPRRPPPHEIRKNMPDNYPRKELPPPHKQEEQTPPPPNTGSG